MRRSSGYIVGRDGVRDSSKDSSSGKDKAGGRGRGGRGGTSGASGLATGAPDAQSMQGPGTG